MTMLLSEVALSVMLILKYVSCVPRGWIFWSTCCQITDHTNVCVAIYKRKRCKVKLHMRQLLLHKTLLEILVGDIIGIMKVLMVIWFVGILMVNYSPVSTIFIRLPFDNSSSSIYSTYRISY